MDKPHNLTDEARAERWRRYHADPDKWFWQRVNRGDGEDACWPWLGRVMANRSGYGRLVFKGRSIGAHRMALILASGENREDEFACHHCDNPVCCNPAHLFWGTHQDNVDDCVARNRKRGAPKIIDVPEMLRLRGEGWKYSDLATRYGVNQSSVGKAIKRAAALKARQP